MAQRNTPPGRPPLTRLAPARLGLEALEDRTALSAAPPAPALDLSGLTISSSFDQDHILVRFQPGQLPVVLAGTTLGGSVAGTDGLYKVQLGSGMSVAQALTAYRQTGRVQLAEPDYHIVPGALSSDDRQSDQWALKNTGQAGGKAGADLDIASAWKVTTGSSKTIVSVMDTGIDYTHPDLYLNIWLNQREIPASRKATLKDVNSDGLITFRDLNDSRNQGAGKITDLNRNGRIDAGDVLAPMTKDAQGRDTGKGGWADRVSNDGDLYIDDLTGWNYVDDSNDVMDDLGHGTHVAGILGAIGNNNEGVAGINWSIQMMPIKFMNSTGAGSVSSFIEGLGYAVAKGARISNNSWTGANFSNALQEAIATARGKGHIFVAAAGNYDSNNDNKATYPAGFKVDNVVAVTATDRYDKLANFANYGARSVTLAAPGVDILSTTLGGGYGYNSGTSMATPQVTGVLALVWTAHPTWTYSQVIRQVTSSVDKLAALAGKTSTGGRVNAGAAVVAQVATPASTPARITSAVSSGPSANTLNKVRVTLDRAMAPATFTSADVKFTNPKGQTITTSVKVVSGSGDRSFDITFVTQTAVGSYTMRVGPEVLDLKKVKMAVYTGTFKVTQPAATPTPAKIMSAVPGGPAANTLSKVRVTFDRAMVLSTFTSADVKLTNPKGQTITISGVKVVASSGDRTFEVTFAKQTAAGSYTMRVGPEVMDLKHVKMAIYTGTFKLNQTTPAPAPATKVYTSSVRTAVTPRGRGVSVLTVSDNLTIADLNVKLNLTHPRLSDLYIHLQAPNGMDIVLFNRAGGSAANLVNTTFDDQGALHVTLGRAPFTGSFQPSVPLSSFNGVSAKGMWKLWVEDRGGKNSGALTSWSLIVRPRA